jgi:5-methylcytosine-specific restriction protein A
MVTKYKICCAPGCNAAIPKGQPRCQKHTKGTGSGWAERPSRSNRDRKLSSRPWSRVRKRIIERDMGLCQACKNERGLIRAGYEADHIDPLGSNDDSNLQLLCPQCHKRKTSTESDAARGLDGL